ncbi:MAG TPA: hypothetical protein VFF91_00720 [Pseudoxanthomonas sp.]|nr:hypothetical protein [Pseudoxanthomonas sp.]
MTKRTIASFILAALPLAASAQQACPDLPPGAGLHWEQQAGAGFRVCRAVDAGGRQVFGVMLTREPTVQLQRRNREEEAVIAGREVHWYRPDIAVDTGLEKRITVVELEEDRYAQIWVDAPDATQLRQAMALAEGIALN